MHEFSSEELASLMKMSDELKTMIETIQMLIIQINEKEEAISKVKEMLRECEEKHGYTGIRHTP